MTKVGSYILNLDRDTPWRFVIDIAITVEVVERRELVPGHVAELTLAGVDGVTLAPWTPGAHVDLVLPSGLVRQYSLCGPPNADTYRVAVLREAQSRGGSVEVHDAVAVGTRLMIRGPRNHFPLVEAPHVVFIGGGIGITPLIPMIKARSAVGAPWELHYGGRSLDTMAYVDLVTSIRGGTATLYPQDEVGLLPLEQVLQAAPAGAVVYACGPEPLLVALQGCADVVGAEVHFERFGPSSTAATDTTEDTEFEVTLQRSARTLTVPIGKRLIDVVRDVVPAVPFSCEEGYCGSCETSVLGGVPDHRDSVLSAEERAANDTMMICVGRACSPQLVLDL